jgi:hypothetical protein
MLRRWKTSVFGADNQFFTCARPGRTGDPKTKNAKVPDDVVHRWVQGLPGPRPAIVSLLGRKPDGQSEFWFYSFFGGFDLPEDNPGRISFVGWLARSYADVILREHPTVDLCPIPSEVLSQIGADVGQLIAMGRRVIIVDSGGAVRVRAVRRSLQAVEDFSRS